MESRLDVDARIRAWARRSQIRTLAVVAAACAVGYALMLLLGADDPAMMGGVLGATTAGWLYDDGRCLGRRRHVDAQRRP